MTFINRLLPERSYLNFVFTSKNKDSETYYVKLPFYENIEIDETKKNEFSILKPVADSSPIPIYTNGSIRTFNINFKLNLLHLRDQLLTPESLGFIEDPSKYSKSTEKEKAKFKNINLKSTSLKKVPYSKILFERYVKGNTDYNSVINSGNNIPVLTNKDQKIIDQYLFWTNIIKSSMVKEDSNFGTIPFIFLNHGSMYQNIMCVAQSYSIKISKDINYHIETLTPHIITVSMELIDAISLKNKTFLEENSEVPKSFTELFQSIDNFPKDIDVSLGWNSVINEPYSIDSVHYEEFTAPFSSSYPITTEYLLI